MVFRFLLRETLAVARERVRRAVSMSCAMVLIFIPLSGLGCAGAMAARSQLGSGHGCSGLARHVVARSLVYSLLQVRPGTQASAGAGK